MTRHNYLQLDHCLPSTRTFAPLTFALIVVAGAFASLSAAGLAHADEPDDPANAQVLKELSQSAALMKGAVLTDGALKPLEISEKPLQQFSDPVHSVPIG